MWPSCLQIQRNPVDRVSPCPMVFVAMSPSVPPSRKQVKRPAKEMSDEV